MYSLINIRAPGLTSGLQGSVNVHRGALLLVPQWHCISSFVFYMLCCFHFRNDVSIMLYVKFMLYISCAMYFKEKFERSKHWKQSLILRILFRCLKDNTIAWCCCNISIISLYLKPSLKYSSKSQKCDPTDTDEMWKMIFNEHTFWITWHQGQGVKSHFLKKSSTRLSS